MIATAALARLLDGILPTDVARCLGAIESSPPSLWPEEEEAIVRATEGRCAEFRTGRAFARAALRDLGVTPCAIPRSSGPSGRAPRWPDGCVGSISHSRSACVAVAASAGCYAGLGIDIEQLDRIELAVARAIGADAELSAVATQVGSEAAPTLVFCAKEAFFKAINLATGVAPDFADATVSPIDAGRFGIALKVQPSALRGGHGFVGGWGMADGHALAFMALPHGRN